MKLRRAPARARARIAWVRAWRRVEPADASGGARGFAAVELGSAAGRDRPRQPSSGGGRAPAGAGQTGGWGEPLPQAVPQAPRCSDKGARRSPSAAPRRGRELRALLPADSGDPVLGFPFVRPRHRGAHRGLQECRQVPQASGAVVDVQWADKIEGVFPVSLRVDVKTSAACSPPWPRRFPSRMPTSSTVNFDDRDGQYRTMDFIVKETRDRVLWRGLCPIRRSGRWCRERREGLSSHEKEIVGPTKAPQKPSAAYSQAAQGEPHVFGIFPAKIPLVPGTDGAGARSDLRARSRACSRTSRPCPRRPQRIVGTSSSSTCFLPTSRALPPGERGDVEVLPATVSSAPPSASPPCPRGAAVESGCDYGFRK